MLNLHILDNVITDNIRNRLSYKKSNTLLSYQRSEDLYYLKNEKILKNFENLSFKTQTFTKNCLRIYIILKEITIISRIL